MVPHESLAGGLNARLCKLSTELKYNITFITYLKFKDLALRIYFNINISIFINKKINYQFYLMLIWFVYVFRKQGERPYVIPLGGSNSIGTYGIINSFQELIEQV